MLRLENHINKKCNEAILISGCARSGTTIIGKIIHSFQNIEFVYEPPTLYTLFALISKLEKKYWKILYETYLYEDFFINAISGRSLNCNIKDDSSIYKVKSKKFINKRLSRSLKKEDAEKLIKNSYISYKMPDIVPFIPKLKKYYPRTTVIIITRKAHEVINSLIDKNWFSNETLLKKNVTWPNREINNIKIPFWVNPKDDEKWIEMDELHRCAYYYILMNKSICQISTPIIIKYDDLINDPLKTINKLKTNLKISWGEKTKEIIDTLKYPRKKGNINILNKLNKNFKEEIKYYSNTS